MVNNYGSLIYLRSGTEPSARAVKATRDIPRALQLDFPEVLLSGPDEESITDAI